MIDVDLIQEAYGEQVKRAFSIVVENEILWLSSNTDRTIRPIDKPMKQFRLAVEVARFARDEAMKALEVTK